MVGLWHWVYMGLPHQWTWEPDGHWGCTEPCGIAADCPMHAHSPAIWATGGTWARGAHWAAPIGSDDSEIFKLNNLRQFFHFHLRRGLCDAFWCYLLHHFDSPAGVLQAGEATHPRTMGSALEGKTRNCPHPMVHTSFLSKVVFIHIYTLYRYLRTHTYIYNIHMHIY